MRYTIVAMAILASVATTLSVAGLDLKAPGRTDADLDRDAYNRPADLFQFWGIKEGMKVMDLFPGDGYTTLLISQIVGPSGRVLGYASYDHENFTKRMKPIGLANVEEVVMAEPACFGDELKTALAKIPDASFDAIVTIRNYHDLEKPAEALQQLRRILKPGGVLAIADSRTKTGRDTKNHRIADDVIIREVTAAGFALSGVSQMLSNPKDDESRGFWQARYIVDQSCLKFTK